jgi:AraC-like DNA-binding protein
VFWIKPDWIHALADNLVELRRVKQLLAISNRGLVFSPAIAQAVRERVADMRLLTPAHRVARFVEILAIMADDRDHRLLCAPRPESEVIRTVDRPRIDKTLDYIHRHYQEDISIAQLADLAALSVSGLHRLFKRHARVAVGEYIARLRIGKACAMLVGTEKPIACIADEVGYTNLSHFNRQFLALKQVTPREFRRQHAPKEPAQPRTVRVRPTIVSTHSADSASWADAR